MRISASAQLMVALFVVSTSFTVTVAPALAIVAYEVPAGVDGNQAFGGNLGMAFNVDKSVVVTHLGVFDDDSNGLTTTLNAQIWNRATQTSLGLLTFTPGDPGVLIGGSRFKELVTPIILPVGFQGLMTGGGFNAANENGNQGSVNLGATTNNGGGLLTFVAQNRYHSSGTDAFSFPNVVDGATPINRYLAGTFDFKSTNIAYDISAGATGSQGNFGGSVGMDFQVNESIKITHLGVFDSVGDGINGGTLTAQLWIRNENNTPNAFGDDTGTLAAQITFTGTQGELIGGSRFLEIDETNYLNGFNGFLGAGTDASIVVFGFNATDPLGNVNAFNGIKTTFDGYGALTFEGVARFGTAGLFPTTPDGGPVNRYAAGTFRFVVVPEPATGLLLLLGAAGLAGRKRRCVTDF